jgi:hypothetical protein
MLRECSVKNVNRHVAAAALLVFDTMLRTVDPSTASENPALKPSHFLFKEILRCLVFSLSHNWSQVRMSGSVLMRTLLATLPPDQHATVYPSLLPSMCLNRHYLAEGVRQFSLKTWSDHIPKDKGIPLVAEYIHNVVLHYLKTLDVDNHVVRESACNAVSSPSPPPPLFLPPLPS